jgi:hypothetical protein
MLSTIILTLFVAVNQAFFMGFFFMISGNFVPGSYDRKGGGRFLKERLMRLGIPLVFYIIIISPLLSYLLSVNVYGWTGSFGEFIKTYLAKYGGLGTGPLWFIETLLIFNIFYVLWRLLVRSQAASPRSDGKAPGNVFFAVIAVCIGVVSFLVRIWLPVGWYFKPLALQFPFFPQYIAMFVLGIIAYRRNWFLKITDAQGKLWLWITVFLIVVVFPIMLVVGGALEGDVESAMGGFHWQSLVYSVWEQFVCIGMVITLLTGFRKRLNHQGRLAKAMSAGAYTMFIIHAPIAVIVALLLKSLRLFPLIKFPLVAVVVVWLCFMLSIFIKKLWFTRRIL